MPSGRQYVDAGRHPITVGESTVSRLLSLTNTGPVAVSGTAYFTYFTAHKTETIYGFRTFTGATAAVSPTLCRAAIYSVAANGDLTTIVSTPNVTSLWTAANISYTTSFNGPWDKFAGNRYAVMLLCIGAGAMPNWVMVDSTLSGILGAAPRIAGQIVGQSDVPFPTVSAGSMTNGATARPLYVEMFL